jgi:hypothetical protein
VNVPPPPGGFDHRYGAPPQEPAGRPVYVDPSAVNVYAPPTAQVVPFAVGPAGYFPIAQQHKGARRALTYAVLGTFVCALLAPVAWYQGLQARAEIRANPTLYTGESEATVAIWLGGIYTMLMTLGALATLASLVVGFLADGR